MSKTILFGGSGFLGNVFLREHPEMVSVGRSKPHGDLSNTHIYVHMDHLEVLDELEFDNVIFLVGNSDHHTLNGSCMKGLEHNVIPLKKILHYLKRRKLNKFVCFSSILLYGNDPKDRSVNEGDDVFPYQNEYIFSKYLAEQVCNFYKEDVPIINVRLCNIYGDTTLLRPDLVPTLIYDTISTENPSVWNKTPVRDFIFTSDAADAVLKLINTKFKGTINIGGGSSYSVGDITKIIENISGKEIIDQKKKVGGVMKFETDISLLKSLTNWVPKHSLEEGLIKTYRKMEQTLL
tara:strand:- start:175 stop:1050 length:876 start_codon:yes stop_codon:yes gene_type:complete